MGTTELKHCVPVSIGKFDSGTLELNLRYASETPNERSGTVDVLDGPTPGTAKKLETYSEEELAQRDPKTKSTVGTTKDIPWSGGELYIHLQTPKGTGTRHISHKVERHPP